VLKPTITFVTHKGKLETQALLLAASLKFFNQNDFELIACVPENISHDKNFITNKTRAYLNDLNVSIKNTQNPINSDYLIGNKLKCLNTTSAKQKLFLDTDILCTQKITLPNLYDNQIAIKPADRRTYLWTTDQWDYAYVKYTDNTLNDNDIIFSSAFNEPMLPYFNAGVIYVNGCFNIANTWSEIAKEIDNDEVLTNKRPWLDQLALPLAIKKSGLETILLTEKHNFPANIKGITSNSNIEILHYHRPSVLCKSQFAIETIMKIMVDCPWLLDVFRHDEDWHCVADQIEQHKNYKPQVQTIQHTLVTQISALGKYSINQSIKNNSNKQLKSYPSQILKPLSRRYHPWGMTAYLSKVEYENKLHHQNINEVIYELDHSLIFGISRIKSIIQNCTIAIEIDNPFKTILSWSENHLSDVGDKWIILNQQKQWFRPQQSELLSIIQNNQDAVTRNALYWCLLIQEVIDANSHIFVTLLDSLTEKEILLWLNKNKASEANYHKIWRIISNHYLDLLKSGATLESQSS